MSVGINGQDDFHEMIDRIEKCSLGMRDKLFKHFIPEDYFDNYDKYKNSCPFGYYESPFSGEKEREYYRNEVQNIDITDINCDTSKIKLASDYIVDCANDFSDMLELDNCRYKSNQMFCRLDGLALFSMIKKYMPNKIIEIGSGFSSCVILDTKEYLDYDYALTCVEPFPDRLKQNIRNQENNVEIFEKYIQDMPCECFEQLEENDILFIDTSHVVRMGGDIPYIYFNILPRLKKGVVVHIHDIFYPFTYPRRWLEEGRPYNEAYILRALLTGNDRYEIIYWEDMARTLGMRRYNNVMSEKLETEIGGSSIWIKVL